MILGEGQVHNQGSVKDGFNQMIKEMAHLFYLKHDFNSKYACEAIVQLSQKFIPFSLDIYWILDNEMLDGVVVLRRLL